MSLRVEKIFSEDFNKAKNESFYILPEELICEVFSHLNLASLGKISLVCKEWKRFGNDPLLWKTVIYRDVAFGNDKWAREFGKDVVKDEDNREEFSSLPWSEYIADCKTFKSIFPEKNAKDRLMLVRLPKTLNGALTLKNLGELAKKYFPKGYKNIRPDAPGDRTIDKSCWVLMTRYALPGSRHANYDEQQRIVSDLAIKSLTGYGIPGILESAACILTQYFNLKIRLFSTDRIDMIGHFACPFIRCKDKRGDLQTTIGGFDSDGLDIGYARNGYYVNIGIAALRKF
jgi:hypothetical protein